MSRVIALCFLLLAAVLGFLYIDSRPAWAPFTVSAVSVVEEEQAQSSPVKKSSPVNKLTIAHPQSDWLPDTGAASVHAASLISLKDGAIRAFWFAGSREGASDVVINSAIYDSKSGAWSAPTVVMDRLAAEKGLSRYIAKLGNPVPSRTADGRLQLFFVTVSIGGWAGSFFALKINKYRKPVLVSSSDGVGTKLKIANFAGRHDTIGIDAVAMNVNDILCTGAEPLFFLDYIAFSSVRSKILFDLVKGINEGCIRSGCSLIGGETAQMPGMYKPGEYDLAGFCVGAVEKGKIIDGSGIRPGNIVIGLESSGIHSNGYSLVRKVLSAAETVSIFWTKENMAATASV